MILVDSCVWIDLLKGKTTPAVRRLIDIQVKKTPEFCISSVIYFEVLRGIASDLDRKKVQRAFDLFERRDFLNTDFEKLLTWYLACEKKGLRVLKLGDWLIVKTLLDHSLTLLTSDKDFFKLQKVIPFSLELT